jgi:hypothetical protein
LKKLFGVELFGGSISHEAILLAFLSEFNLPFVVQIITFAFLGCWALIVLALVIHFQYDDHNILLDVVAHVETCIFSVANGTTKYLNLVTPSCP